MYNNYKVNAIVQARMTSSRLPGKVLLPLGGKPVLQNIIERLRRSKYIDDVIVATTTNEADNAIIELCDRLDCSYYRGSEDDVLSRVLEAAKKFDTDIIVEVTADCPMISVEIADFCIEKLVCHEKDYVSNVIRRSYPRGLDVQVFWTNVLDKANKEVDNYFDRSHVSSWIYKNPKTINDYKVANVSCNLTGFDITFREYRLTLDTEEDYILLQLMFEGFKDNTFKDGDIFKFIEFREELFELNKHIPQKSYYKELMECYKENGML